MAPRRWSRTSTFARREAWDALGFPIRRADALAAAGKAQTDPVKSAALHWEAALAFGNYYLLDRMKAELADPTGFEERCDLF